MDISIFILCKKQKRHFTLDIKCFCSKIL